MLEMRDKVALTSHSSSVTEFREGLNSLGDDAEWSSVSAASHLVMFLRYLWFLSAAAFGCGEHRAFAASFIYIVIPVPVHIAHTLHFIVYFELVYPIN